MKFIFDEAGKKGTVVRFEAGLLAHQYSRGAIKNGGELLISTGKEAYSLRRFLVLVREVVRVAKTHGVETLVVSWKDIAALAPGEVPAEELATLVAENMLMAGYQFSFYKNQKAKTVAPAVTQVVWRETGKKTSLLRKAMAEGVIRGTYINWCRNLANTPGNDMTPRVLAAEVRRALLKEKNKKLSCKILGEKEMKKLKMGGVLAVGKGSKEASQFIIVEYRGGREGAAPVALVGKGVTFDSGGIDTKPSPYALDMMMDMSGGAAVLATTLIAAKLGLKKNIIALVPAVENMPSGESFRPGDIIKMLDGTTVEIGHTDAEGRLILADAISYAKRYKPSVVIDVATLTGAASVALGERATALFSADDKLAESLLTAGERTGDSAWRLPLWEEYASEIVGNVADIANVRTKGRDGVGGAITAATFLAHFAKEHKRFAHLDMAPTMTPAFDEQLAKGAKGSPIRLLVEFLKKN
jgi:leucyl aminopeptidase